ncbi:DUF4139 domain-containing protein [Falsiroseomonas stagni]|uniref:DUF4139 domain-containing protein n=1 Tax=Falsiroseomonas stagni DSM 19981 TaxID=1123062 RepID=A0A1I3Z6Q9_9PROT|nr:DUF4139 domain-containing protein [Falsiroseomonas stagni]SFK39381.1 protein of unknown function [Falsiroseomonas stagni DSM 19981]
MRAPLLLLAPLLLAFPASAQDLPVTAVTLSNAGLAQIERSGRLDPGAPLSFRVPVEDVDDVLKSLLVRDPAGRVEGVRLPAQDLVAEAFRGLPLKPEDFANRTTLLRALRGQAVEAAGATGRLVDAEEVQAPNTAPALRLTLVTEQGLRSLALADGDGIRFADPDLAARLRRAAEALAAASTADSRVVEVRLAGAAAAREVSLGYVAAAPLWKPSWRLVIPPRRGEARLQGWAVVENRSGADWEGVRLALVSGNPAAFQQALYAPIRVARPELPVRVAEGVSVRADTGATPPPPPMPMPLAMAPAMAAPAPRAMASPGAGAAPEAALRFADSVAAVPAALPASAAGRVAFALPNPVTVRSGETANLPFLDATLPAERLWWVQDLSARNPLSALRLRNTSGHTLPDGLATLYGAEGPEAGAFLGDAEIRAVAPGETRLVGFARDRDLRLSAAQASGERPAGATFRRGVVVLRVVVRQEAALALDPGGAPDAGRGAGMVVDLPRRPGFTPRFTVAAEGDFGLRHEVVLDGGPQTLRFAWEQETSRELPVWDAGLGDPILLRWRDIDVEQSLRRLPGGPATLENLRATLERLPAEAPGRDRLAALAERMAELRGLLDTARTAIRGYRTAEAALARARAAAEDRSGAEREEARRRLNAASLAADRAGTAADAAWDGWARAAQDLLARME